MPTIAQLERLLAAEPHDAFLLYALAQEHAKAGDHVGAVAAYDRCLAVDSGSCYAYFHKARSLAAHGEAEAAIATLEEGLAVARRSGDAKAAGEIASELATLRGA
jgi:tetratricopeptide (TPR) repeat protein